MNMSSQQIKNRRKRGKRQNEKYNFGRKLLEECLAGSRGVSQLVFKSYIYFNYKNLFPLSAFSMASRYRFSLFDVLKLPNQFKITV